MVAGYVLGRSRKLKLAITVGGLIAGRKVKLNPQDLLAAGNKLADSSPELRKLTGEVRERLLDAARKAAVAAAASKIDSLGENLSKRAAQLQVPEPGDAAKSARTAVSPDAEADEDDEADADDREEAGDPKPRKAAAASRAQKTAGATRRRAGKPSSASGAAESRSAARKKPAAAKRAPVSRRAGAARKQTDSNRGGEHG
ncbi:MAG: hypothetical protein ACRDT8_04560 [Micromonosporaceae bacterium]